MNATALIYPLIPGATANSAARIANAKGRDGPSTQRDHGEECNDQPVTVLEGFGLAGAVCFLSPAHELDPERESTTRCASAPHGPKEVASFMPYVPKGAERVQSNDVCFDENGLIYLIDRTWGLHILERG